jgi:TolA-binding protein
MVIAVIISIFSWHTSLMAQHSEVVTKPAAVKESSQNVQNDLEKSAEELFMDIRASYDQGKFWECARDLVILIDFYPSFSKSDQAMFMLGDCLYEIDLTEGAKKIYLFLVKKYVRSELLGNALLGLQRIEHSDGDFMLCLEYYQAILRANPNREVLDCSRYYAGLSYYKLKDYPNAIEALEKVSVNSPYYDYSLYTMALAKLRMKKIKPGIAVFQQICALPLTNDERRQVMDEAHLSLGYVYYELGQHQDALTHFRSVSSNYKDYANALLAAGWSAAKMGDYRTAIDPLTDLVSRYSKTTQAEEAMFLIGDCYLRLGSYDDALKIYNDLLELFPKRENSISDESKIQGQIAEERGKLEEIKMELLMLESRLMEIIPIGSDGSTGHIQKEQDDLGFIREDLLKQIYDERQIFNTLSKQMDDMEASTQLTENRRDWRAFAEYGRSRVMFLKSVNEPVAKP